MSVVTVSVMIWALLINKAQPSHISSVYLLRHRLERVIGSYPYYRRSTLSTDPTEQGQDPSKSQGSLHLLDTST